MRSRLLVGAAAGWLAIALAAALAAAPASADPRPTGYRTYAAVGSAATSPLWNGLSNGRASIDGGRAVVPSVASYDGRTTAQAGSELLSGRIRTKPGGSQFMRPGVYLDGVQALSASNVAPYTFRKAPYNGTDGPQPLTAIRDQVDFAHESVTVEWAPGDDLTWIPFARDAVSVVGRGLDPDLANLTRAELSAIYGCRSAGNIRVVGDGHQAQVWYDNGTTVKQRLYPMTPNETGDVRSFFWTAIASPGNLPCVNERNQYPNDPKENDGRALTRSGEIIPFLASAWIAQKNGMTPDTVGDPTLRMLTVDGLAPTSTRNGSLIAGPLFGASAAVPRQAAGVFFHDVYNVIDSEDVGTALESTLTDGVRGNIARYTINRYGFKNIDYLGVRSDYLTTAYFPL